MPSLLNGKIYIVATEFSFKVS